MINKLKRYLYRSTAIKVQQDSGEIVTIVMAFAWIFSSDTLLIRYIASFAMGMMVCVLIGHLANIWRETYGPVIRE